MLQERYKVVPGKWQGCYNGCYKGVTLAGWVHLVLHRRLVLLGQRKGDLTRGVCWADARKEGRETRAEVAREEELEDSRQQRGVTWSIALSNMRWRGSMRVGLVKGF
jgi:hypothetical protein